jgi:hypothetical protein
VNNLADGINIQDLGREDSGLTKRLPIVLFSRGSEVIPPAGIVCIQYSNEINPGASIVIHPILPGKWNMPDPDVLPMAKIFAITHGEY